MGTLWSIFIFFYHFVYSTNDVSLCKNGIACGHGHICQDNVCKECIKCTLLFRKGTNCESDFNDCGPCLPGYKEISTTNFSKIVKPCRLEKLKSDKCINDEDCPVGSYCYEKYCAVCFNCTLFNKLPPSNGCAKDFNKCGFCIDGFYELPVTTDSNIKPCERITPAVKNHPVLILSVNNLLPFCILLVFAAVVIKIIIEKNKARSDVSVANCERSLSPSAPPLFVSNNPESLLIEEKNEKCSMVTMVTELKQQANMARVFKQPCAPYYFAEDADDANDHSNDSHDDASNPPQRYAEVHSHTSPNEVITESIRNDRQLNISINNVDSETLSEEAVRTLLQTEDSNSPTS